jgi:hypothetical protein
MTTLVATTANGDLVQSTYSDSKIDTILAQLQGEIDTANNNIKLLSKANLDLQEALEKHRS